MERYVESLFWVKYRQYIHFDQDTKEYVYDPELPDRAKRSFELWLKENK